MTKEKCIILAVILLSMWSMVSHASDDSSSIANDDFFLLEPNDNILASEKVDNFLIKDKPVLFTFLTYNFTIYQVVIIGKDKEEITIKIESLRSTSKLIKKPAPGIVYENLNIWTNSKNVNNTTIYFKVKDIWIKRYYNVILFRFDVNEWKPLNTKEIGIYDGYRYFESDSTSLSIFAISAMKEGNDNSKYTNSKIYNIISPIPDKK